jgi:hypothetical protein
MANQKCLGEEKHNSDHGSYFLKLSTYLIHKTTL